MEVKHTPGPWAWDEAGHCLRPVTPKPEVSAVHTILSPEGCFGYMSSDFRQTIAENDANLRLIAAAPELLAVLQLIANNDPYAALIARTAIAKATRGQS